MSRRLAFLISAIITAMFLATALTAAGILPDKLQDSRCHANQPVYSKSYQLIGTWNVTLPLGQAVALPDGDTATCARSGLVIN